MGDDEKGLRGERWLEKRARREEMVGILLKARIESDRMNRRDKKSEYFDLTVIHTAAYTSQCKGPD